MQVTQALQPLLSIPVDTGHQVTKVHDVDLTLNQDLYDSDTGFHHRILHFENRHRQVVPTRPAPHGEVTRLKLFHHFSNTGARM